MTNLSYLCLNILIPQGTDCVKRVDDDVGNNDMESDNGDIITISDDEDEPGQCIPLDKCWSVQSTGLVFFFIPEVKPP